MTQLYVGNLTYAMTEPELRSMFERYGRVTAVRIATDISTGRSRGFAFVSMPFMDDAEEAIVNLNGTGHSGRTLVVNEAQQDNNRAGKQAARLSALALLNLI